MKTHTIHDLFREYQRRLDVRAVLQSYGAQNCFENTDAQGHTWITHSCLLDRIEPHHSNGDARPSASVCVETGHYHCFSYWSGSIFSLVQKLEGCEPEGVLGVVTPYLSGTTAEIDSIRKAIRDAFEEKSLPPPMSVYSKHILDNWMFVHPYMRDVRGIDQETHEFLKIGYDETANRIIFPHFWQGELVGWQKRAIPPSDRWPGTVPDYPKYQNSSGFPKKDTLYNYTAAEPFETVIVVESPMSVARAYSNGFLYPGEGPGIVATFGASISAVQIDLLRDFHRVYCWMDDDPAGHSGERKLVEGLYRSTGVFVIEPDKGRDLGDIERGGEAVDKFRAARPAALWLRR